MYGRASTARSAAAGGHAHRAGTGRGESPGDFPARPARGTARMRPLADGKGNWLTQQWPLRSYLELGALPGATPCARLHVRQLLWEWRLPDLADAAELVTSELVTNAVRVSRAEAGGVPVRLWLLADAASALVLVGDASPQPPERVSGGEDDEGGRGLLLVETLSARWNWFVPSEPAGGKVVWALIRPD